MTRDFTLIKYEELLTSFALNGRTVVTVAQYLLDCTPTSRVVVLRHDVDRNPEDAFRMADLEARLGVATTYYFRHTKRVFQPESIRRIARLGHEIGYHYEVLDRAKGDIVTATALFTDELSEFRRIADIKTCAMHGNPLTKWDNRDFWKRHSFAEFGLIGEAYLSFTDVVYLSDTGRTWSPKNKVKDWMPSADGERMPQPDVSSTDDLLRWLNGNACNLYLTVHPERWSDGTMQWSASLVRDLGINMVKRGLRVVRPGADSGSVSDSGPDGAEEDGG